MSRLTPAEPQSLADVLRYTREREVERFGHAPRRSMFGTKCLDCGRVVHSFATGPRHGTES